MCLYEQEAEGDAEAVDEDVAGGLAQTLVELAAFVDAAELEPREDVEDEIDKGQHEGEHVAMSPEQQTGEDGDDADGKVEPLGGAGTQLDDEGHLAVAAVYVAVAVVVDNEQAVDDESAGQRGYDDQQRTGVQLDVIGAADGYDAEEDDHQHVAQADIGEVGGVEEAEDDAEQSDEQHFESAVEDEWQSDDAGGYGGGGNGALHGVDADPALCAGALWPESGGGVVVASGVVEEVVDEVGVNLHDEGKEEAKDGSRRAEDVEFARVEVGQCCAYHDGYGGTCECLGASGKEPCFRGVLFHRRRVYRRRVVAGRGSL